MPISPKVDLTRNQFEFLCKRLFKRFLHRLNKEDLYLFPKLPNGSQKNNIEEFVNEDWEEFIMEFPNTTKSDLSEIAMIFVDQVYADRRDAKIGKDLKSIIHESETNKQEYANVFTSFLKRKYERDYKPHKKKEITFGGTKKAIDKYKYSILIWYLGYDSIYKLIDDCPRSSGSDLEAIVNFQSKCLDRDDEWDNIPSEFIEGKWRMEASENESIEEPFSKNFLTEQQEYFRYVHKRNIEYDIRFSYWCDLEIKHFKQKGFFYSEGILYTNTMVPELNEWTLKGIGNFRSSRSTQYLRFDFEMIPKDNVDSPRTFGYGIARPFLKEKMPIFEGFYLANRMRDPFDYADKDNRFMNGLRISMGRLVIYKKD